MNSYLQKIVSGFPVVLVDFYADWCAPCKLVVPVLEDVLSHFDGKVKLHKIDIDEHPELTKSLLIMSVPTLILFRDGKEVWRIRGFDMAPTMIKQIAQYVQ